MGNDSEQRLHDHFDNLENAVSMAASHRLTQRYWFTKTHHVPMQARWDQLRTQRERKNQSFIVEYGERIEQLERSFTAVSEIYWRAKPSLQTFRFNSDVTDIVCAPILLLEAAITWHESDSGYWKSFIKCGDISEATVIREQLEASEQAYPITQEMGRDWIESLRDARGQMLLANDRMPRAAPIHRMPQETKGADATSPPGEEELWLGKELEAMFGYRHSNGERARNWVRYQWIKPKDKQGFNGSSRFDQTAVNAMAVKLSKQPKYPAKPSDAV